MSTDILCQVLLLFLQDNLYLIFTCFLTKVNYGILCTVISMLVINLVDSLQPNFPADIYLYQLR